MIDRLVLLNDLQKLLVKLQDDLRARCAERPEVEAPLRAQHEAARAAKRTAEAYEAWREAQFTQAAVAWILSCVFIRFLEDNRLLGDIAYLSGPGERLALARDQRTIYFRQHPTESDREYLYHVFGAVRRLPGLVALFHDTHNPVWHLGLSGDGAQLLLEFWQKLNAEEGQDAEHAPLVHDFSDPNLDTRFLGDLYQDLSEDAQARFALKQTPVFIEEFILDRTLTPAVETFGYQKVRMIDPTCGSGHFALGGFHRLFALHQRHHPAVEVRVLAQRALDQVFGVDLNPYAVAIARFRLLLAALHVCDIHRLADAPAFEVHVATGDSLLHGSPPGWQYRRQEFLGSHDALEDTLKHFYETEDAELARRYLSQDYHAVVGNPPYIIVKDKALNEAYRLRFESCHRKYSMAVPFMEQFFALAIKSEDTQPAGYVGMITANSFMKREMGKKLIERFIPKWNLTHILDAKGAYIPGHGTPTVILFGTNRKPVQPTIRTVMGIKGEPTTPENPALGLVWTSIMRQVDHPGSESDFVSVADIAREKFLKHPWSIGGGGAAELQELIDECGVKTLESLVMSVGFGAILGEDEIFSAPAKSNSIRRLPADLHRPLIEGESIRDWHFSWDNEVLFPYTDRIALRGDKVIKQWLWPMRELLARRLDFSKKTFAQCGRPFWEFHQIPVERNKCASLIAFAEIASHNHFVLSRGSKLFNRTAPVMQLPATASEADHATLVGFLNSSLICFRMKQVAQPKQMTGGDGVRIESRSKVPYQFSGTQLLRIPIPEKFFSGDLRVRFTMLSQQADQASSRLREISAECAIAQALAEKKPIQQVWASLFAERVRMRTQLILLQEQIDFTVYAMFDVVGTDLLGAEIDNERFDLEAGQRPFEIAVNSNEDGFVVPKEIPEVWPDSVRNIWAKRIEAIRSSKDLRLIEDPHYKRRWIGRQGLFNHAARADELSTALRGWLLDRLEDPHNWPASELTSCAHLADKVRRDPEFVEVATLYRNRPDFDLTELVVELVESESVPFLPVLRYKESGLRKRAIWEQVWEMQRREDAIDDRVELPKEDPNYLPPDAARTLKKQQVGDIPVPSKYDTKDFVGGPYWGLRGKLDVPKERFITYPHCNRDADRTPVIGWAGWDHLRQAQAVAGYYERMRTNEGWSDDRLLPLLAGVLELLPWLLQWHNTLDSQYGMGLGDFFRSFVEEEARRIGKTLDEVRAWKPPQVVARGRRRAVAPAEPEGVG